MTHILIAWMWLLTWAVAAMLGRYYQGRTGFLIVLFLGVVSAVINFYTFKG